MDQILKEIRVRLRRSMNGILSSSMREKGVNYKMNFGVPLPEIKQIASCYEKDAQLAATLWAEDVREMKILALLLQPPDLFTQEQARQWGKDIRYQEIAELYGSYLLPNVSYADQLAEEWIKEKDGFLPIIGFLLYGRLFASKYKLHLDKEFFFLQQARIVMDSGNYLLQRPVIQSLKRYGRLGKEQSEKVLKLIEDYPDSGVPEKEEFFDAIKFDLEYYNNC